MKRTDITKLFPDATDEQISELLGINGTDINNAKAKFGTLENDLKTAQDKISRLMEGPTAEKLQAEIDRANGLQAELDAFKKTETIRGLREKVSVSKNIPITLLTGETEDDCVAQADAILAFAKPAGYPAVKDGGEPAANGKNTNNSAWLDLSTKITKT